MNKIYRDIFKAIHEGKWIYIEYRNRSQQITKYWIAIKELDPLRRTMSVEGMHLGKYTLLDLECIYIDAICDSKIIEGSYYPVNEFLVDDIAIHPQKYDRIFDSVANLKILSYLEDCSRMDATPYYSDFSLLKYLDRDGFRDGIYHLSDEQFHQIVKHFRTGAEKDSHHPEKLTFQQLGMNVLSIYTQNGLYVLAYRKLFLNVNERTLIPEKKVTICNEFTVNGVKQSARRFLDGDDYNLLYDFEENEEKIKDSIINLDTRYESVDDLPYVIGLGKDTSLDLHHEYNAILDMYAKDKKENIPVPIKAFFGDLVSRQTGRRNPSIYLLDNKINLDQLLAINNALKYPVTYIQGPPGTGKTNTILNTILSAFLNERTVLFACFNNHPIDSVVEKLSALTYHGMSILFPVIRLGNYECMKHALKEIRNRYYIARKITIFDSTLNRNQDQRKERSKELSALLKKYEEQLDLEERKEAIESMLSFNGNHPSSMQGLSFETDLQQRQIPLIDKRIHHIGNITDHDALKLIDQEDEELKKYLYFISAKYLKKIDQEKNQKLKEIIMMEDEEKQLSEFSRYLSAPENLSSFLEIFPIIATTCISAHKLGQPEVSFDMTIIDEASQCNTAIALVPILRGKNLMLVGDPQQLNPVILLDEMTNEQLKEKYAISEEYDYRKNSIYKTYLASDSVSDEILLRSHYRCHPKIVNFNNQKYYNSKLVIFSKSKEENPLEYIDMKEGWTDQKNTAPLEAEAIVKYASENQSRSIGIITPFVNQKNLIKQKLEEEHLNNVDCGTVHAFQGDEKDVILFSTTITDKTYPGTYDWLKNNKELINVATSRARDKLIIYSSLLNVERLHENAGTDDDLYDLIQYVRTEGTSKVNAKKANSRALGIKPFSTNTEEAFLTTLNHALDNIFLSTNRFSVEKEVPVSQVFQDNIENIDLFYSGRFDFVLYEKTNIKKYPLLVIELDGKEHFDDEIVMMRDEKKQEICALHSMQLIRVENTYARRYQYVKEILEQYFTKLK